MRHHWSVLVLYFVIKLILEIGLVTVVTDLRLLFFHLAFSPFLFFILQRLPYSRSLRIIIFIFDLLFPIAGQVGGLLFFLILFVVKPLYTKKGKELYALPHGEQDYKRYMVEKKIITKDMNANDESELYLKFFHIDPVIDVIAGDDKEKKIKSIQEIGKLNSKDFILPLQNALQDEIYEVRYLSKNIIEGMEKKIMDELDAMHAQLQLHPTDYHVHNSMARAYITAARTGIFDEVLARNFLVKAFDSLTFSLQIFPDQKALYVRILEIFVHLKEYKKCAELGPKVLAMPMPQEEWCKLAFYYAEALFHIQEYSLLKETCENILDKNPKYQKIREVIQFWSSLSHDAI